MRIHSFTALVLLLTPLCSVYAAGPAKLKDESARISYSLGYQIGGDFKRQGVTMDSEAVVKGIRDAITGAAPMMSQEEMQATLIELKRKIVSAQRARLNGIEKKNIAQDKKFLEANARKDGVVTTKSGLQYKIITPGSGKTPGPTDKVTVHYRGTLSNGQVFDSSRDRGKPATFQLNGVIKGWSEGLQHIKEGGKIQLVIPPSLAYDRGPLEKRVLVFEVELISVGEKKQAEKTAPAASAEG